MAEETLSFQAEVARLLDIVVHSLYSQKEIFLRELVSNASDACDKLRYKALTEPELLDGDRDLRIELIADPAAGTLAVRDNGIGMNRDDLVENLGTIAKSGTGEFLKGLTGDAKKDMSLIGQFGVGFYSAFMVAGEVEVLTRKAGDEHGWRWVSDGKGSFTITAAEEAPRGTTVLLRLHDEDKDYAEAHRLRHVIKTYSDHIALPVVLKGAGEDGADETLNTASALWTRPKAEITEAQYKEFYHHAAHAFDEPWLTVHYKAEGAIEYTGLLFVPSQPPFDLFQPDRKTHVKLYVNRVFITDDCEGLLPRWLRFCRGVVDSPDLPLNVSREMLQHQPLLRKIQAGLVKRLVSEIGKRAEADGEGYAAFWEAFGSVLKEGLYEGVEHRDDLLRLCRFRSTEADGLVSLADYVGRMKDGQEAIYVITGDDAHALAASPQVEGYKAKGVEVLLLTDPIDEFWPMAVPGWKTAEGDDGKTLPFKSVAQGAADLSAIKGDAAAEEETRREAAPAAQMDKLLAGLKTALGEAVKDVRVSDRLTASACCLVAEDGEMSIHLERLLRQHQNAPAQTPARVLEVNPSHGLIKALAAQAEAGDDLADMAHLLLDQARIVEGEQPADPVAFARRLSAVMEKGL